MKAKYIGDSCVSFEKNKIYNVVGKEKLLGEILYAIIDESNEAYLYPLDDFEIVEK